MRPGSIWGILAGVLLLAAAVLSALAWLDFRAALSARLDRAEALEAAAVKPAAAAVLTSVLLEHRLTLLSEAESKAISAAFARVPARVVVEAYRKAGGRREVLTAAERALAATSPGDADGEVALLRAVRLLRDEFSKSPSPRRPEPPESAARAGRRLLFGCIAAGLASACAFAAGRTLTR